MGNLPGLYINLQLRLSRPKPTSWFGPPETQKAFKALQTSLLKAPALSLPTGSEFILFVTEKRLWPHCLRVIANFALPMTKAPKFTNGQNLTVLIFHDVSGILNSSSEQEWFPL